MTLFYKSYFFYISSGLASPPTRLALESVVRGLTNDTDFIRRWSDAARICLCTFPELPDLSEDQLREFTYQCIVRRIYVDCQLRRVSTAVCQQARTLSGNPANNELAIRELTDIYAEVPCIVVISRTELPPCPEWLVENRDFSGCIMQSAGLANNGIVNHTLLEMVVSGTAVGASENEYGLAQTLRGCQQTELDLFITCWSITGSRQNQILQAIDRCPKWESYILI